MKDTLVRDYDIPPTRIEVVPLGWKTITPLAQEEAKSRLGLRKSHLIVFHGFLDQTKGLEELIRAFVAVTSDIPDSRLLIVGEESPTIPAHRRGYVRELESLAERLAVRNRITFTGYVDFEKLSAYLSAADVIVLPYSAQSVLAGSAVLSLVAPFGRPLVVSRTSRFVDDLADGQTALMVTPGEPGELADAIRKLARDPELAGKLGANLSTQARTRTWEAMGVRVETLFSRFDSVSP